MDNILSQILQTLALAAGDDYARCNYDARRFLAGVIPLLGEKLACRQAGVFSMPGPHPVALWPENESAGLLVPVAGIPELQATGYTVAEDQYFHYIFPLGDAIFFVLTRDQEFSTGTAEMLNAVISILGRTFFLIEDAGRLKEDKDKLQQEKDLLRTIIDNIPDPVYVKDALGRKILLNQAEADLLSAASVSDVIGKTDEEFYPADIAEKTRIEDEQVMRSKIPVIHREGRIVTRSGQEIWFEGNKIPYADKQGNPLGIIGISHNISGRKKTEEKLARLLHQQNLISGLASEFINIPLDSSDKAVDKLLSTIGRQNDVDRVYIFRYDFTSRIMSSIHEWCAAGVIPKKEMLQSIPMDYFKSWVESHQKGEIIIIPEVDKLDLSDPIRQTLEPHGIKTLVSVPMILEGECIGFVGYDSMKKVKVWSGEEIKLLLLLADMLCNLTDRQRTEKALITREAYLKAIFNNVPYQMWLKDMEGKYLLVNLPFLEYFGFSEWNSPIGKDAWEIWDHEIAEKFTAHDLEILETRQLKSTEEQMEIDGNKVWFEIFRAPIIDADGRLLGTTGIARDITSRKIADQELKKATAEAQAASIAKTRFLANMSHEIRTPLNAIIGMVRLLLESSVTDPQMKLLGNMKTSSETLLSIINDILDFSKIESGQMAIEHTNFSMDDVLKKVYDANEYRAEEKGIKFTCVTDQGISGYLKGDPVHLQQILMNLVSNAIKFTQQGFVELRCTMVGNENGKKSLFFLVEDTGIGISPENQNKIFSSFQQEDESITRTYGGTGLGLAISRQLVELMGGQLCVESAKNAGSKFYFTLEFEIGSKILPVAPQEPSSGESYNLKDTRVLLVEDNKFNQFVAQAMLEKWQAKTVICEDGQQAVDVLKEQPFDLVLMDIQMPVMDGITAATIIRQELKLNIPILALTANVVLGIVERCENAGMQGYVSKPIDEPDLFMKIKEVLAARVNNEPVAPEVVEPLKLVDLSRLTKMVGSDTGMLQKLLEKFLEVTPESERELNDAWTRRDADAVQRLSHKLKSAIDLVSTDVMRDLIKNINDISKSGLLTDDLGEKVQRFATYYTLLSGQLKEVIKSG